MSSSNPPADSSPSFDAAALTTLFLTRERSRDPFARSAIPEQNLYRGEAPNRMSVFGFTSVQPPYYAPPVYNHAFSRPSPPPYKAPLDIQPSPLSSHPVPPPPSYQPAAASDDDESSARPSMSEPPSYASQVDRERQRERRRNRDSIAKDNMVETTSDADAALCDTETGRYTRKSQDAEAAEKADSWCCGCFWVRPAPLR